MDEMDYRSWASYGTCASMIKHTESPPFTDELYASIETVFEAIVEDSGKKYSSTLYRIADMEKIVPDEFIRYLRKNYYTCVYKTGSEQGEAIQRETFVRHLFKFGGEEYCTMALRNCARQPKKKSTEKPLEKPQR